MDGPSATTRRAFLKTASLAGIAPFLGACAIAPKTRAGATDAADEIVSRSYLHRGLLSMAAVPPEASLGAHAGAAVIATWYFCRENALDEPALLTVRARLDEFIAHQPSVLPAGAAAAGAPASPDRIAETLAGSIADLRANGHDAIFGAMALQALQDAPELAVEPVVEGICRLLRGFTAGFPVQDPGALREEPPEPYRNEQDLLARTFAAMARARGEFERGERRSGAAPIHWYTHTDAVLTLADCGYPEVARLGHFSLQQHVHGPAAAPAGLPNATPAPAPWLTASYWDRAEAREPLGFWSAGHVFKFPFSLYRLVRRTQDAATARAAVTDATWMLREPA